MLMQNESLLIEKVGRDFKRISEETMEILKTRGGPQYEQYAEQIQAILAAILQDSLVKVALIGQYSAGKSTIISALTGDKKIKIDADIATDQPADYQWNGLLITDTPGLYTERTDHNLKTYEAIKSSDLLVYVLTSDLFDDVVLENFLKLAYEHAYRNKMMLVINKMSMESGDYEVLKNNYYASLDQSLLPHDIDEFPLVFMDAADYIEGIDDGFEDLIETSHFDEFIHSLNAFVKEKGLLGKVDTPIRMVCAEIGKALTEKSSEGSKPFFLILERMEHRVKKSIDKSQNNVNGIMGDVRSQIVSLGNHLTACIGAEGVDFEGEQKKIEIQIKTLIEEANEQLEEKLKEERDALTEEIKEILNSDLATTFFESVRMSSEVDGSNVELKDISNLQKNFKAINDIVHKASGGILQLSNRGTQGLVGSTVVRGTELHKGIYSVGKFFGYSFKPWQAVNAAKFLTNVAKIAGPILAVAGIVMEITGHVKEEQDLQKVLQAKNECSSSFISLAKNIEVQFQKQFDNYKKTTYHTVLDDISSQRQEAIARTEQASMLNQELQGKLEELKKLIAKLG
jgi:hypothetical protein